MCDVTRLGRHRIETKGNPVEKKTIEILMDFVTNITKFLYVWPYSSNARKHPTSRTIPNFIVVSI